MVGSCVGRSRADTALRGRRGRRLRRTRVRPRAHGLQLALNSWATATKRSTCPRKSSCSVFRTTRSFRGQSALKTWIYRIVINQARNRQRWWRRRHRADQVSLDQHVAAARRPAQPGDGTRRTARWRARRLAARLWAALDACRSISGRSCPARGRWPELRRDRVLARRRRRHGQVAAHARAADAARRAPGDPAMMLGDRLRDVRTASKHSTTASCRSTSEWPSESTCASAARARGAADFERLRARSGKPRSRPAPIATAPAGRTLCRAGVLSGCASKRVFVGADHANVPGHAPGLGRRSAPRRPP